MSGNVRKISMKYFILLGSLQGSLRFSWAFGPFTVYSLVGPTAVYGLVGPLSSFDTIRLRRITQDDNGGRA